MKRTHTNTKATTTTNRIESLAQASARPPTKNIYILIAAAITNFLSHFYRFVVFFVSRPEEKVTFVLVCFIDQNTQNGPKYCCCSLPLMLCRIPKWYDCTVKREIGHRSHWLLFLWCVGFFFFFIISLLDLVVLGLRWMPCAWNNRNEKQTLHAHVQVITICKWSNERWWL